MTSFNTIGIKIIAMATIVGYALTRNELSPQRVFNLLEWLEAVRYNLFMAFEMGLMFDIKGYYSCKRIDVI